MAHRTTGRLVHQIKQMHAELTGMPGLPVARWLPADRLQGVLDQFGVAGIDRIYSPLVTVWLFVSQMLESYQSCVQTVARLLADRAQRGLPACSPKTGAYCMARQRLPAKVLQRLVEQTGQELAAGADPAWRWRGHRVLIVDGTRLSMPDTPANHQAFAATPGQKPGLCFPLAQLVVVFSLAVGSVLAAAIGSGRGKGQGETSLWHTLRDHLQPDDVVLADRYYSSFAELAWCQQHRMHVVMRQHVNRRTDFRRGRRLGPDDHVVEWSKPAEAAAWLSPAEYAALPATLTVREVRVRITQRGFRDTVIVVVTTLLDAEAFAADDVADLFRARWQAELHLRSLKTILGMDVLRCRTPDLVRKEIWAHLLAYNLLRTVMAQAAAAHERSPMTLSFAGALQTLAAFAVVAQGTDPMRWHERLLAALARHTVGHRPDRLEPRASKRRPKSYPFLMEARAAARSRLLQRCCG